MEDEVTEVVRSIPLSKLTPSEANVRRTNTDVELGELTASIKAHGLLQNLTVKAVRRENGKLTGTFEVIAGGRRLLALRQLADENHVEQDYPVPCRVIDGHNPVEISLAENVIRAPIHPADQFEAFAKLHADGLGSEDIASRFGISALLVTQRLKLAAVSPKLLTVYREGGMALDQLMAFTVTDDHKAQEKFWFESSQYDRQPHSIRRALTKSSVSGSDRRAHFIGSEAYEQAGGTILRDLFQKEENTYFTDSDLLDRLVSEKLVAKAEELKEEGWSWLEIYPELDYGYLARMGRVDPTRIPHSEEVQARLTQLSDHYDSLVAEHGEEPPEEIAEEVERLATEIDQLSQERGEWSAEEKMRSGVIVALDYHGNLRIEQGLLKPQPKPVDPNPPIQPDEQPSDETQPLEETEAKLPDTLIENLSAHRTAALQAVLAGNPELALTSLVHTLALRTFYSPVCETCVDVRLEFIELKRFASGIAESKALQAMADRHSAWRERLPTEDRLWSYLVGETLENKLSLLAYCTANAANAVELRYGGINNRRRDQAEQIAIAVALDMADWWEPTVSSYFDHVTKGAIVSAVAEGVSGEAADAIRGLKKQAMALQAEQVLAGKRWLPLPLRAAHSGLSI